MKKKLLLLTFCFVCLLFAMPGTAQVLDYQNVLGIKLNDGTDVILYGRASDERMTRSLGSTQANQRSDIDSRQQPGGRLWFDSVLDKLNYGDDYYFTNEYYYLPTNLRLSKRPDGVPEFLFLKYTTDQKTDAGGVQGALMHFLLEWGLTPAQETELKAKLIQKFNEIKGGAEWGPKFAKIKDKLPVLMGPVKLNTGENSFNIISATLKDNSLTSKLIASGSAPTTPGQKVAVAANLNKNGAQLLAATFDQDLSIADLSLELRFKYNVLMPAFKAKVTIDYIKMQQMYERKSLQGVNYVESGKGSNPNNNKLYVSDVNILREEMLSAKVVDIQLTETMNSSVSKTITEAIMNMVVASFKENDEEDRQQPAPAQGGQTEQDPTKIRQGRTSIDIVKMKSRMSRGKEVINLDYRMNITEEVIVSGNLGSWYGAVKNNPKCVAAVNLNDPFYQHRDINLVLDLESEQMFGQEVNYVTVNVRKVRSSGAPFTDAVTIDRKYLQDKGVKATMTYARANDNNPDTYEYKAQWSLKGGKLFPENPSWIKGDWQGVTLDAPLTPRNIEFEADLGEMSSAGIVRATLQMRYSKFGQEIETNIPMTVSKNEPLTNGLIFVDKAKPNYAYRLVLTHKVHGKLILPWDAKINDEYVYAILPQGLLDGDTDVINGLKEGNARNARVPVVESDKPSTRAVTANEKILHTMKL